MATHSSHVALGFGTLLLAVFAIFLQPFGRFILLNALAYGVAVPAIITPAPMVTDPTRNIKYIGTRAHNVEHFQNIFYGEDTSGKNRFAPPVPFHYPEGSVVDATQPGAWCPQGTGDVLPFTSRVVNVSENCLSLRIARPTGTEHAAKLPVMVWIHGGGHALGSAYEILYTPDGLVERAANDGQPLIFVAINYRLGFFGFATSRALVEAQHTNAGLRDQRAALEWIRDNIKHFGGDPERVTAVGQSVGASDISLQMTSFGGTRGVSFQQAIMMSGAPGLNFNTKSDLVANNTATIARGVRCASESDNAQSDQTITCLRNAPVELLTNLSVTASRAARPPFGEGFFFPTYDGDIIRDRPSQSMRAGKFVKGIPIIASWVTNDGAWYVSPTVSTDEEVLASFGLWLFDLSASTKERLLNLYPLTDFEDMVRPNYDGDISPQYYRAAQMNRDIWFTCPVLDFAWQYVKNGGARTSEVRLCETNSTRYTPVFEKMGVPMWRVAHLSDIPYVLDVAHLGGGADNSASQLELGKSISRAFLRFVTEGPRGRKPSSAEEWPAALEGVNERDMKRDFPNTFSMQLFGGPYGNRSVTVSGKSKGSETEADKAVRWEKLLERCSFINSAKMREEAGV